MLISIEIISMGEKTLETVLKSIKSQRYNDYEIICVDPSTEKRHLEMMQESGVKVVTVTPETKLLKKRFLAHQHSKGDFSLVLDSTKPLEPNALETLVKYGSEYDMICLAEGVIGKGFWATQARYAKTLSTKLSDYSISNSLNLVIPRFYRSDILTKSFEYIMKNVGEKKFSQICGREDFLIFESALKYNRNVGVTKEILLNHYIETKLQSIVRKYHRHGRCAKYLKSLQMDTKVNKFETYLKWINKENLRLRLMSLPINLVRGLSFTIGYYF